MGKLHPANDVRAFCVAVVVWCREPEHGVS